MPQSPVPDDMAWLRARVSELEAVNARLREAARDRDELGAAQLAARDAQIAALAAQVEELRRRLDKDSSTSSRPPSSDSPSNQAERDVRPVKVQQRTSGGTWRTLRGLADFAIVQSYLSTTAKWGIDALDALTMLNSVTDEVPIRKHVDEVGSSHANPGADCLGGLPLPGAQRGQSSRQDPGLLLEDVLAQHR